MHPLDARQYTSSLLPQGGRKLRRPFLTWAGLRTPVTQWVTQLVVRQRLPGRRGLFSPGAGTGEIGAPDECDVRSPLQENTPHSHRAAGGKAPGGFTRHFRGCLTQDGPGGSQQYPQQHTRGLPTPSPAAGCVHRRPGSVAQGTRLPKCIHTR